MCSGSVRNRGEAMKLPKLIFPGCLSLVCCFAVWDRAVAYDPAADFSPTNNPNGVWSYGSELGAGSAFQLFGVATNSGGLDIWSGSGGAPLILHNGTSQVITSGATIWEPNDFGLRPVLGGTNGTPSNYSVARFTAPSTGVYRFSPVFYARSTNTTMTDVHVLLDGQSIFDGQVNGTPPYALTYSDLEEGVLAGGNIDFLVGSETAAPSYDIALSVSISEEPTGPTGGWYTINSVVPNPIVAGSNLTYQINVHCGEYDLYAVSITNVLPPEVRFLGAELDAASSGFGGRVTNMLDGTVIGYVPYLAGFDIATLVVSGELRCTALSQKSLVDTVSVASFTGQDYPGGPSTITATNPKPTRQSACSNAVAFTETFADKIYCGGNKTNLSCEMARGEKVSLTAYASLLDADITALTGDSLFALDLGDYHPAFHLSDDPRWRPGKMAATFVERQPGAIGNLIGTQTIRLKWNLDQLAVRVSISDPDAGGTSIGAPLGSQYDGLPSGSVFGAVPATIILGNSSNVVDAVYYTGAVATTNVVGRNSGSFSVSKMKITGSGGN